LAVELNHRHSAVSGGIRILPDLSGNYIIILDQDQGWLSYMKTKTPLTMQEPASKPHYLVFFWNVISRGLTFSMSRNI
jgi:hypothetical protein